MPLEVVSGSFFGLPQDVLQNLMNVYTQALTDIAVSGQSHAITGRTFTLAQLPEIRRTIQELQAAINRGNGTRVRQTRAYGGGFTI